MGARHVQRGPVGRLPGLLGWRPDQVLLRDVHGLRRPRPRPLDRHAAEPQRQLPGGASARAELLPGRRRYGLPRSRRGRAGLSLHGRPAVRDRPDRCDRPRRRHADHAAAGRGLDGGLGQQAQLQAELGHRGRHRSGDLRHKPSDDPGECDHSARRDRLGQRGRSAARRRDHHRRLGYQRSRGRHGRRGAGALLDHAALRREPDDHRQRAQPDATTASRTSSR